MSKNSFISSRLFPKIKHIYILLIFGFSQKKNRINTKNPKSPKKEPKMPSPQKKIGIKLKISFGIMSL